MQYPLIRFIVCPSPTDTRTMTDIERYLRAATRDNTRRSYQAAIEHFETHWGGFLPATAEYCPLPGRPRRPACRQHPAPAPGCAQPMARRPRLP
ncbi:hypothetical protein [Pseudomonas peli]|uniref:hypothetical protein n=1 Tax=Pseudomonas peli TaxID=592361 RepID=UPI0024AD9637|nr:hypothetical protein [Pseudomonas peli]